MSANKKPRKAYTPRPALLNSMTQAISADDCRTLKLVPHAELTKLQLGNGDECSFHTLAARLNFGMVLATKHDFGMDLVKPMDGALFCLLDIKARFERVGKWGVTGADLTHIGQALVYTDDMQDATTRRQHRDAMREVMKAAE